MWKIINIFGKKQLHGSAWKVSCLDGSISRTSFIAQYEVCWVEISVMFDCNEMEGGLDWRPVWCGTWVLGMFTL